jgi:chromosome segregation ATPase
VKRTDVEAAVAALRKAGVTPSVRLIREHLGFGSLTDISRLFAQVKDQERLASRPENRIPDHLQEKIQTAIESLWLELSASAHQHAFEVRQSAERQVREANTGATEALATADGLMRELKTAKAEISSLERLFAEETLRRTAADTEVAVLRQRLEDLSTYNQSLRSTIEAFSRAQSGTSATLKAT